MMKLKKLKLHVLAEESMKDRTMNALRGGNCCTCSCYWEGNTGSSSNDNRDANYNIGSGGHSTEGCNQYYTCDGEMVIDAEYMKKHLKAN
ncbi:rSAM-modified peptide [Bacteroides fragilis]|uniref:RSAM-modified peptide n=2 Tax=Bacteroides TaxID=816 RepID=A0A5M5PFL2_BACFG|nr:rSAM-modified peptide [Bacteroides fragilis]KAA4705307.1 rSAM-modified peptide [Bacteroides fragilis]KAA4712825.1 rSAM-modified peptide [Bacteroides fragilis]KAA4723847.1 rSAM-modified peptide [Bacteroides fragilis]KAA4725533.1 rSAM-modified peptide [Bacteroides fragilis]